MPYIPQEARDRLDKEDAVYDIQTPGELNYALTMICSVYLQNQADKKGNPAPKYYDYNEVMGALECCKLELYRRLVAPYEDESIERNGDVH